jgi:hypothetical protein
MTNVSQSSTVQSSVLSRADQPTTEPDKFAAPEATIKTSKLDGRDGSGISFFRRPAR